MNQSRSRYRVQAPARQRGVVLLWALGILLILTILSVGSVKLANINTQIAGNSIASMMVFQGVESTLSRTANMNYINQAAINTPGRNKAVPSADLPNEAVTGGSLSSSASVGYIGYSACPAVAGVAMSTNASASAGGVTCQIYQIDAQSRLKGTGAKAEHVLGVAVYVPPMNASVSNLALTIIGSAYGQHNKNKQEDSNDLSKCFEICQLNDACDDWCIAHGRSVGRGY